MLERLRSRVSVNFRRFSGNLGYSFSHRLSLQSAPHAHMALSLRASCLSLSPHSPFLEVILDWGPNNTAHLQRPYFHTRSHSQVLGVRTFDILFKKASQSITPGDSDARPGLGTQRTAALQMASKPPGNLEWLQLLTQWVWKAQALLSEQEALMWLAHGLVLSGRSLPAQDAQEIQKWLPRK